MTNADFAGRHNCHSSAGSLGQRREIVKRSDCAKGFIALPKRWIVRLP
jgi:hypothetical protein